MYKAVLMLYGNHALHPWQEDMFSRPDLLQDNLRQKSLEFHIGCVTHAPTGRDELPTVRIARTPEYDENGVLLRANFEPGAINDYPVVIDHWVANFQDDVTQTNGDVERVAYGIGLPAERLVNHKQVQTFGNRKDKMQDLLKRQGVAIDTWPAVQIEQVEAKYGQHPLIYKPLGGSRSKGIRVFDSPHEAQAALETEEIAANGLMQPFFDTTQPLPDLLPLSRSEVEHLRVANAEADRAREVRMYVMVTTNRQGRRTVRSYPEVKTSAPGTKHLPYFESIVIHPDSFPPGSYLYDKSVEAALALAEATGVPHLYGAIDWIYVKPADEPQPQWLVCDFNCRGPGLWYKSTPARAGFVEFLSDIATQNMQLS